MANIVDLEGVGAVFAKKLKDAGISTTDELLETGATPKGRKDIAEATGISESLILEWVNHVDLYRIKGMGSEYTDLFEEAGVDTVMELAQRNGANLYKKLIEINDEKKLVRRLPGESQLSDWIAQAKKLPRRVTY